MKPLFHRMPGLCILIVLTGTVGCVEERTTTPPAKWVTAFEQPDERPLMKRKLLSTIPTLGEHWRVSFEVFPESFNHKGLASVLHMMTGEKANKFGKHIPAVWIHRSKAIFVSTSLGKKTTFTRRFRAKELARRKWTQIEASQSRQGENHIYAVKIGGKQVFSTKNTRPRKFYDVKVYAASPSSSPLAGSIRNIKIEVEGIFLKLFPILTSRIHDYSCSFSRTNQRHISKVGGICPSRLPPCQPPHRPTCQSPCPPPQSL